MRIYKHMRMQYEVDGLPPPIKAKITQFDQACQEYAFMGSQPPEDHEAIVHDYLQARYNLERTIKTLLERKDIGNG